MALNALSIPENSPATKNGPQTLFKPLPTHIDAMSLGVATAENYTVPTNAKYLVLSATGDFYVRSSGTAAVPAAEITDGSGSDLNPVGYVVDGGETLSFISPAATVVTIAAYKKVP